MLSLEHCCLDKATGTSIAKRDRTWNKETEENGIVLPISVGSLEAMGRLVFKREVSFSSTSGKLILWDASLRRIKYLFSQEKDPLHRVIGPHGHIDGDGPKSTGKSHSLWLCLAFRIFFLNFQLKMLWVKATHIIFWEVWKYSSSRVWVMLEIIGRIKGFSVFLAETQVGKRRCRFQGLDSLSRIARGESDSCNFYTDIWICKSTWYFCVYLFAFLVCLPHWTFSIMRPLGTAVVGCQPGAGRSLVGKGMTRA